MTGSESVLADVPVFASLDDHSLARLAERASRRCVAAGSVVVVRDQPCDHLIVVETGGLTAVYESADGGRLRLGEFPAPCAIDKIAVLDASGHTATWIAAADSELRLIRRDDLLGLIDDVPAVRRHVLAHLATQARRQQELLAGVAFGDVVERVAEWLVRKAGESGVRVALSGDQAGLGESVAASRVSVNRALRVLAGEGLIRTERGAVTVLAPELLAQRARTGSG